jgi:hypothetical protein
MAVLFRLRQLFQRVQAFFLVECHGEQDGFHGVVVALIGGRLGVAADAVEQAVEVFLILAAQRAAEFCPARRSFFNQLAEGGNGAAHRESPLPQEAASGSFRRRKPASGLRAR